MASTTTDRCQAQFGDTGNFAGFPTRELVIREAMTWQGTPFHDCSSVKGHGCDCVGFLKGVFVAVGLIENFEIGPYAPQWFAHRGEPLFLEGLAKYARQVEKPLPGDILMFNFGRHAAHGAILVDERTIIHALKVTGFVTTDCLAVYMPKFHSAWSIF